MTTTAKETWRKMWMVEIHKFVLALALGVVELRLASPHPLLNMLICGFAFVISTSVGVAIGIVINNTDYGSIGGWIFAVRMGIYWHWSTSSFRDLVTNHLLGWDNHKLPHKEQALFRWLAFLVDCILGGIVLIWD